MNHTSAPQIFDKSLLKMRDKKIAHNDFLRTEINNMLSERIAEVKREFGCHLSFARDAEFLNGAENSADLISSSLAVHWTNDVVGLFFSAAKILRPDGFFVCNFFGGDTLTELKNIFLQADKNSISPRISPFIDIKDAGMLLQRAGFALPVVDSEKITVTYENIFALMKHLKKMGENNALVKRRKNFTPKSFFEKANELYLKNYADEEGRIIATYEIITISGWKPAQNQQKPLKRGSAKISLKDVL